MSKITLTMRHTGRIYVGMAAEDFAALYSLVLWGKSNFLSPSTPAKERIYEAFDRFVEKLKSNAASHSSNNPPIH